MGPGELSSTFGGLGRCPSHRTTKYGEKFRRETHANHTDELFGEGIVKDKKRGEQRPASRRKIQPVAPHSVVHSLMVGSMEHAGDKFTWGAC
jgi:hypothetical protein